MIHTLTFRLEPKTASMPMMLIAEASKTLDIDANRIKEIRVVRRSIDARQKRVMVNVTVKVAVDTTDDMEPSLQPIHYPTLTSDAPVCIIVGAGPAGLFAALRLIELGIKPVVLERGKDVDERRKDMAKISREGVVDPDSNYCFGEGGAGAFSDGKLYTRSKKRGPIEKILHVFHQHGAKEDILIDAHPHIGSDKLPDIIKAMRNTIINAGGEIHFQSRVTRLLTDDNHRSVTGVETKNGKIFHGPVILATGHSARDVYESLHDAGIEIEPKGIAVGVRLEHPQELIDRIRYHSPNGRGKYLPAAEYTMLTRVDDRAVYSFCMCPGGFIIPAASAPGEMVVNGMSPSNRGTKWANSGMVVEVLPEDVNEAEFGNDALKMMRYQQAIERKFYENAQGTQNAPAQRMMDFVSSKESKDLPATSYAPGIHTARIDKLLPKGIATRLQKGFEEFGKKNRGFLTNEAVLIGDETRTSSPVRVPRDSESLQHISYSDLYPCGEGAGYAGGIVSAAVDGERCAELAAKAIKSKQNEL